MQQQVLGRNRLLPLAERMQLARGRNVDDVVEEIRSNVEIEPVVTDLGVLATPGGKRKTGTSVPGFYVSYTAPSAREAQSVCGELTSMLLSENQSSREQVAQSTTDFISRQLDEAKRNLDDQDAKLAVFKRQYAGQLPGDEDNNLKVLGTLNSQLDANTQTVNRAQQDKSYTESLLAQQLSAWKSSQGSNNPQSLQQQLSALQSQLLQLQARYTEDHPDVIKTKADIAEVKKRMTEVNDAAAKGTDTSDRGSLSEPPEIRQLRLQVHQYAEVLAQAIREEKRLADQIRLYQSRVAISPDVEEKYKLLTRDYETAQKFYTDLLAKKSTSEMATDMEKRQQGEQDDLAEPRASAGSPELSQPAGICWRRIGRGLGSRAGVGVVAGASRQVDSHRSRCRSQLADASTGVLALGNGRMQTNGNGNGKFWNRDKSTKSAGETVEV